MPVQLAEDVEARPVGEGQARRFEMTVTNLLHDPTVEGLVLNYSDITERALYQEDPKFASTVKSTDLRTHMRRRLRRAALVLVLGFALLLTGLIGFGTSAVGTVIGATTAVFSVAAGLCAFFTPLPLDLPRSTLLWVAAGAMAIRLLAFPVRRFTALIERRAVREMVERDQRPALPRVNALEVKQAPMEAFTRLTVGLVLFNVLARPAILCFAVWLIRDPGAATAACFVLAYLAMMNTAELGGQFQTTLAALRLRAFLRQTRGSSIQEVDMESLAHFRRIEHVAHIQWPAWRRSRERRWEDYDLPFKPIRAYVIHDPQNRAWTREKTFHTHESTSYLFFRSPPRDAGGSPFARYVLLHELGHAHPLNFYTPGRKLEFTVAPGVGLVFAWVAGFGPLTLGVIATFWGLMLVHYASEGVRLAHELSADAFAYRALDERDLRILPRLLKVKARHDRRLLDRAQRRLALARLMVVRQAVRALDAGEEIPQRFLPPRRPPGPPFALAAAATVFLAPVPAHLSLLPLLGLALAPLAATIPMMWMSERYERANAGELAARTRAPADPPRPAGEPAAVAVSAPLPA